MELGKFSAKNITSSVSMDCITAGTFCIGELMIEDSRPMELLNSNYTFRTVLKTRSTSKQLFNIIGIFLLVLYILYQFPSLWSSNALHQILSSMPVCL